MNNQKGLSKDPVSLLESDFSSFELGKTASNSSSSKPREGIIKELGEMGVREGGSINPNVAAHSSMKNIIDNLYSQIENAYQLLSIQKSRIESAAFELLQIKGQKEKGDEWLKFVGCLDKHPIIQEESSGKDNDTKWILIMVMILAIINFCINITWNARLLQSNKPYSYFKDSYDSSAVNSSLSLAYVAICAILITKGCKKEVSLAISVSFSIIVSVCGWLSIVRLPADIYVLEYRWFYGITTTIGLSSIVSVIFFIASRKPKIKN